MLLLPFIQDLDTNVDSIQGSMTIRHTTFRWRQFGTDNLVQASLAQRQFSAKFSTDTLHVKQATQYSLYKNAVEG